MLYVGRLPDPLKAISAGLQRSDVVGAATSVCLKSDVVLRGFIAVGSEYSVHPIDVIDADGNIFELPTTCGLLPSLHPAFDWQIDTRRRLLTVLMAEIQFRHWVRAYIEGDQAEFA
jgi:hypothetical protein